MIHGHKLRAIMEVKGKALFSKNFIIMPLFAIGFTYVMKLVYGSIGEGEVNLSSYVLSMGVLMNICMTGVYCVAATLAEEKEKNTLRTLMTSSVNGLEFFLGSLIPVIIMMITVNILCVFISGLPMNLTSWLIYLVVSTLASTIGAIVGMIFGIFAKNQMSAGTLTTPVLIVLMLIPMFANINDMMQKVADCLFTGVVMNIINQIATNAPVLGIKELALLIGEMVIAVIVFLVLYRKNGFEAK